MRPYSDTTGGKQLVYIFGQGAVLVPKDQLPKKQERFLSYCENGVELVEGRENVKRPSWKYPRR